MSNATGRTRLYRNIALIEFADEALLAEVIAGPLGRHVVRRISETVIVVDHAQVDSIVKALRKGGYTPRVTVTGGEERV